MRESTVNNVIDAIKHVTGSGMNVKEIFIASNIFQEFYGRTGGISCLSADNLQFATKRKAVCCVIDFSEDISHEVSTNLTFEELKKRTHYQDEPLASLNLANAVLEEGGKLAVVCTDPINQSIAKKYLLCAKFTQIQFDGNTITAQKRALHKYSFDRDKITFEETTSPQLIKNIHYFAKGLFRGYNYDLDIDDIFTPYSDFYVCYNTNTKGIISFLRHTWYLPHHYLPSMLATTVNDGLHIVLEKPDDNYYSEIFSPFINSLSAVKAYRELVNNFLQFYISIGLKYVFTTYDKSEAKSGEFYRRIFGFEDTGITLRYGTFGGDWGLLKAGEHSIATTRKLFLSSMD